jgi:hypothetical protein
MINMNVYGIHGEGRILCQSCAKRLYGISLEMYLAAGEIHWFSDNDRPTYAPKGLLCDDCYRWIFRPDRTEDRWWLVDPDPEEHLRLLAPFADFLETLNIDTTNLRSTEASRM